ncbi:LTA synthase family protein [Aquisalibacillus elongatus]|uniref:Phosphoglycerol transferase MdoB-like AlkP superfamily enzyme n=1 Tax=Aquisalibacillus elongatus TaxID=485577 RepID=A0A3N5BFG9_9BACI|nr:LTA synthase family protein [Aquisalibacillus elongatus]RPF55629.1 phosphoglycerol transferase MdoB-like AlkP superfamily enzyme [Aquisalibacillus elongatus]
MERIKRIPLFIVAAILVGLKTYVIYRFYFNLSIESTFQEIILFINAFAFSFFIFSIGVWMNPKRQRKYILIMSTLMTFILIANLMYYRNFTDFITLPTLMQVNNAGDLGTSVTSLVYFLDIFLLLDFILIFVFARKKIFPITQFSKLFKRRTITVALAFLVLNLTLAEIERPMLFKRGFDREYLVKNVGIFTFHGYDAFVTASTQSKRIFADGSEFNEIEEYVSERVDKEKDVNKDIDLTGMAEDKNIVYIAVESLQDFVIDQEVNGDEITPYLNDLIDESYYFDNFYHQTALGKTSDHELLLDTSLYPLPNSAAFFTHAQNEYFALPEIIKEEKGYQSYAFHANNASFWNRNVMYETLGYEEYYDVQSYDFTKDDVIGWGMNDKMFFDQTVDLLKEQEDPYYAKLITLTNHFPFDIPEDERSLEPYESESETLSQYFQTVRYTDEAIEQFMNKMKQEGLYEDTIFIIGGDHYGVPSYHNDALGEFLNKDMTAYEDALLQQVPMIIHIPGHDDHQTISTLTGQVDYKPTVLNMLGIELERDIRFGSNMFDAPKERKDFIAFRDGRVVGTDYVSAGGACFEHSSGDIVDDQHCAPIREKAEQELNYSDEIIYGDLLRFYDFESGEIADQE